MNKIKFEPQLIGVNQEAINEKIDRWEYAAKILNDLATQWKSVFKEDFSIKILKEILITKSGLIEKYLKSHYISLDPEYAKFAGKFKMDVALSITQFPDFRELPDLIKNVVKKHFDQHIPEVEYDQWINQIFLDGKFLIAEEMKTSIEKEHTYFTSNVRENLVLELIRKLAVSLNVLNDIGAAISPRDLPRQLDGCFTIQRTGKKHEIFKTHYSQDTYGVMHLVPSYQLKFNRNSIYSLIVNNLSDSEVNTLYEKLVINK